MNQNRASANEPIGIYLCLRYIKIRIKCMEKYIWIYRLQGASLMAQQWRIRLPMQKTRVRSWVSKIPWRRKWKHAPSSIFAWKNPMDCGDWWAIVHGVTSQTWLKWLNNKNTGYTQSSKKVGIQHVQRNVSNHQEKNGLYSILYWEYWLSIWGKDPIIGLQCITYKFLND